MAAAPIRFRHDAAQPFDARCLSWQISERRGRDGGSDSVDLDLTANGRLKRGGGAPAAVDLAVLRTRNDRRKTDLIHRDGKWLLYATVEYTAGDANQSS